MAPVAQLLERSPELDFELGGDVFRWMHFENTGHFDRRYVSVVVRADAAQEGGEAQPC